MNLLFFYNATINPQLGGIQRVTSCLGEYLNENEINVFYLSTLKTSDQSVDNQFYFPDQESQYSEKNRLFYTDFIVRFNIHIVINQAAISPYISRFISLWTKQTNAKLISVLHNSLFGMYGLSNHFKFLNKIVYNTVFARLIDNLLIYTFKLKYGKIYTQMVIESDKVVLLSEKFEKEIISFSGLNNAKNKIVSISNPTTLIVNSKIKNKEKQLLFVGRFSFQKRLDLLLIIWSKLHLKFPDWSLYLVGDGEERISIENSAKKMNLTNIYFEGFQSPEIYYDRASVFCMTSAFEGFGLVLVEAMAYGCIPFAFKSYPNVVDIIDDNENGELISPFLTDEYAEKLSKLMDNEDQIQIMANNAKIKSDKFRIEIIGNMWLQLFKSVLD